MFYINEDIESKGRFDLARFVEFSSDDEVYDFLGSFFVQKIQTLSLFGIFTVLEDEGRLDNIAYKIYQDTSYWWILMVYNNLVVPHEVENGAKIRYPSPQDLEKLFFDLKRKQFEKDQAAGVTFDDSVLAPTDLLAIWEKYGEYEWGTGHAYGAVHISWTNNSTNELGVRVERKNEDNIWGIIATMPPATEKYADPTMTPGHLWTYRVFAYNASGQSGYSNEAFVDLRVP